MMMDITNNETYLDLFQNDYQSAQGYHRRAEKFSQTGRPSGLVFHIASMALERYLVALCDLYGISPKNHDYACLMEAAETVIDFPSVLNQEIRSLDEIFGICSLEVNPNGDPEASDARRVLVLCAEVRKLFDTAELSVQVLKTPA